MAMAATVVMGAVQAEVRGEAAREARRTTGSGGWGKAGRGGRGGGMEGVEGKEDTDCPQDMEE